MRGIRVRRSAGARTLAGGVLALVAAAGCGGGQGTAGGALPAADVAGCYAGDGLAGGGTAYAGGAPGAVLVLDTIVEPGGKVLPARVVGGTAASAARWQTASGDAVGVVLTAFPPVIYTLHRADDRLLGSAQRVAPMPGVSVDTTSWDVALKPVECGPALGRLPGAAGDRPPFAPDLRTELADMGAADQAARREMAADSMADTAFARRLTRGDSVRTARLREIVAEHGWPAPSRAGVKAAAGAFLVLQHSPSTDFQRRMLPRLDSLARIGEADGQDAALLTDRVLKGRGSPQRYGTQFDVEDGRLVLWPIEDSAGVEARRDSMGLMPLSAYVGLLESMYRSPPAR